MADHQAGMPVLPGEPGSVLGGMNVAVRRAADVTNHQPGAGPNRIGPTPATAPGRRLSHPPGTSEFVCFCSSNPAPGERPGSPATPSTAGRRGRWRFTAAWFATVSAMRTAPTVLPPARNCSSIWTPCTSWSIAAASCTTFTRSAHHTNVSSTPVWAAVSGRLRPAKSGTYESGFPFGLSGTFCRITWRYG